MDSEVSTTMKDILARIEKKIDGFTTSISAAERDIEHLCERSKEHTDDIKRLQNRVPAWVTVTSTTTYSVLTFIIGILITIIKLKG